MGITFPGAGLPDARRLGASVGAAFASVVMVIGFLFADGEAEAATLKVGLTVLAVAAPLGWFFAPGALRPGLRPALATSLRMTLVAVPLGALITAFFMATTGPGTLTPGEVVVAVPALAFVGLLLLGLPLAGLTFGVINVWLGVLRLATYGVSGGIRSYGAVRI